MRKLLLALALTGCASSTTSTPVQTTPSGTPEAPAGAITEADLRARLFTYAHDSMGGRMTGEPGLVKATDYIARELARLGLKPGGDNGTYFQAVPVVHRQFDESTSLGAAGQRFVAWKDYLPRDQGGPTRNMDGAQVVYGGDLANVQALIPPDAAAGKVVVIRNNIAPNVNRLQLSLRFPRAVGVLVASLDIMPAEFQALLREPQMVFNPGGDDTLPSYAYVSTAMADRLLGASLASLQPGAAGGTMQGSVRFSSVPMPNPVRNVIGIVNGSDPALRNTYVVIGAHSDHVGKLPEPVDHDSLLLANRMFRRGGADSPEPQLSAEQLAILRAARDSVAKIRPPRMDSVFNGADDDGSGSMALLEIAEWMTHGGNTPRRSVLFIWQTSEELGLWGSEWFTDHPTVPRDSIIANVNVDMIGRGSAQDLPEGGPRYLQVLGSKRASAEYGALVERVNAKPEHNFLFDYTFDQPNHPQQYFCRSDHWNYARYGIPTVFFSTGGHADYHMPTDEAQYINYPHFTKITRFLADLTLTVAGLDSRPKLDRPAPGPNAQCVQ